MFDVAIEEIPVRRESDAEENALKKSRLSGITAAILAGGILLCSCGDNTKSSGDAGTVEGTRAVTEAQTEHAGSESGPEETPHEEEAVPISNPETSSAAEQTQDGSNLSVFIPQMMGQTGTASAGASSAAPDDQNAGISAAQESAPQPQSPADTGNYTEVSEVVYAKENVNVRKGPGTDYEKLGALFAGESVKRTGLGEEWSRVLFNNAEAYIKSEFLTTEEPQTQPAVPPEGEFWSGDLAAIQALSNRDFTGCADESSRDGKNVPNGCYYLTKLYHKYHADFIQDTNQNIIYLTMDEGYEAGYTPTILQTLREKNVKAVFFVTKQFFDSHPELIEQMIADGHIVGNHTCSHKQMPKYDLEWQGNDIMTLHNLMKDRFGYEMKLFRYPEGLTSEQSMAYVASLGYTSVFWSFAYIDYDTSNQMDPAVALERCVNYLHPGAIYLLHAVSSTNTAILGQFIDEARARGFEFGVYPVQ